MKNKLWQQTSETKSQLEEIVEAFTVGNDVSFDLQLAKYDVLGSLAHIYMLQSVGLITKQDYDAMKLGLEEIQLLIEQGDFEIYDGVEDIHSQIELLLTQKIGDIGKKIHTGRSRNDQVLLDIKLFIKNELQEITSSIEKLFHTLITLSEEHKAQLLPGYTHFQLAMPSSFGLWFGAYAESLTDDMELILAAYNVCNKNPLGSGAGYGSSFPLNRTLTTNKLGFNSLNYNVVYAQMTRGKTEKITAMAMASVAATLSKFAYDVCLYLNQNFGFISFPKELTTGSSIMPHKKNPDVFELIRAKCNRLQALPNELTLLTNNLPSGYHRDWQLTKECLFPAITSLKDCLSITDIMLKHIQVKKDILLDEQYKLLFTVENVNENVLNGMPFRDAYHDIAKQVEKGLFQPKLDIHHVHEGSIGNLCNEEIKTQFQTVIQKIKN